MNKTNRQVLLAIRELALQQIPYMSSDRLKERLTDQRETIGSLRTEQSNLRKQSVDLNALLQEATAEADRLSNERHGIIENLRTRLQDATALLSVRNKIIVARDETIQSLHNTIHRLVGELL